MPRYKEQQRRAPLLRFAILCLATLLFSLALAYVFLPKKTDDKTGQTEEPTPKNEAVLYIDAGHGGFDLGATATLFDGSTLAEKDLALLLACDTADILREKGYTVHLSRKDDRRHTYTTSAAEVYARVTDAEEKKVTHLISIHANAYAGEGRAYGARVYYDPAKRAAARAASRFAAAIDGATEGQALRECRTVPDGSYAILKTKCDTALLFECGFLSDEQECALLADEDYRTRLACGIAAGIESILAGN